MFTIAATFDSRSAGNSAFVRRIAEKRLSAKHACHSSSGIDGATLAEASRLTGYASDASFSHAFRQWAGIAPGAWRRTRKPAPA